MMKGSWSYVCRICLLVFLVTIVMAEDFYSLLGVQKSATTKEIRKAFKKLAITKHPDKNKVIIKCNRYRIISFYGIVYVVVKVYS